MYFADQQSKVIMQTFLYPLNWLLSLVASVLRLGAGKGALEVTVEKPIILYEFEGCPFCRIAREAVSETGVKTHVKPCPKGGKRFREELLAIGGKAQFPYMVDPNTDVKMYESADIAKYICKTYGSRGRPIIHWLGPLGILTSQFAVLVRLAGGNFVKPSTSPETPLQLVGSERSPATRIVKELLCEMELEYEWLYDQKEGEMPSLFDPNTGERIEGALSIRTYLKRRYRG